jgi:hypothetical protein
MVLVIWMMIWMMMLMSKMSDCYSTLSPKTTDKKAVEIIRAYQQVIQHATKFFEADSQRLDAELPVFEDEHFDDEVDASPKNKRTQRSSSISGSVTPDSAKDAASALPSPSSPSAPGSPALEQHTKKGHRGLAELFKDRASLFSRSSKQSSKHAQQQSPHADAKLQSAAQSTTESSRASSTDDSDTEVAAPSSDQEPKTAVTSTDEPLEPSASIDDTAAVPPQVAQDQVATDATPSTQSESTTTTAAAAASTETPTETTPSEPSATTESSTPEQGSTPDAPPSSTPTDTTAAAAATASEASKPSDDDDNRMVEIKAGIYAHIKKLQAQLQADTQATDSMSSQTLEIYQDLNRVMRDIASTLVAHKRSIAQDLTLWKQVVNGVLDMSHPTVAAKCQQATASRVETDLDASGNDETLHSSAPSSPATIAPAVTTES